MADDSEKQLNFEQQVLKILEEKVAIRQDELSISNALTESIKEALGITRGRNATDAGLLNVNREINRSILNQKEGLTDVGALQKVIAKNQESINKANRVANTLAADLLPKERTEIDALLEQIDLRDDLNAQIEEQLKNVDEGVKGAAAKVEKLTKERDLLTDTVANESRSLSNSAKQVLYTRMNAKGLERQNALRKEELVQAHLTNAAEKTKGFLLGGHATLFAAISAAVLKSSQLTNQFQQELGTSYINSLAMRNELVNAAGASNDLFINSEKLQKSFFALKDTTGVFFDLSSKSAETFTNLTERIGLAGAEAGNLTMLLRLQGKDTEATMSNLVGTASAALATSKSTASVKQILGDVASSSKGLQASLAANPGALAKAAVAARELGATLKDIEGTQKALLDFESSIGAELEAELLTGKQLNLERARAAALNNDLKTVSEELLKQGVDLASFGKMNVLQQEKMAAAMGMSRDAMGDMLLKQQTQNMTADEVRKKFGEQTYEQFKALSAQDKFNAGVAKLKDLFVGVMTALTPVIDLLALALTPISLIAKGLSIANEFTGGFTNALIGVGLTVLALKKKFGGLGDSIGKAFSKSKVKGKVMGAMGGTDKAGAAAGKATAVPAPADNGVKIRKKLQNLARGLKAFANTKVLLGALNLIPAALGFTAMTVGAVGLAAVALMGTAAGIGLQGLGNGLIAFGNAMAAPTPLGPVGLVAPVALALLGASMIPFANAVSLTAPAIEALGTAISAVFGGLATAVTTVIPALVQGLIDLSTNVNLGGLVGLAIGLGGLSLAIAGLATSAMLLLPALPVLAAVAGIGAVATGAIGGRGGGGGAGVTTAQAGGASGEEIRAIVEETVTATINALVPEMVAALKEGQGKIQVTNDNFTNSNQSEGPSRNRNIVNNNFA